MKAAEIIKKALIGTGIMLDGWRWEIEKWEKESYSTAWAIVNVWEPRKQKVSVVWRIPYDMCRNLVDMNHAECTYNRYLHG